MSQRITKIKNVCVSVNYHFHSDGTTCSSVPSVEEEVDNRTNDLVTGQSDQEASDQYSINVGENDMEDETHEDETALYNLIDDPVVRRNYQKLNWDPRCYIGRSALIQDPCLLEEISGVLESECSLYNRVNSDKKQRIYEMIRVDGDEITFRGLDRRYDNKYFSLFSIVLDVKTRDSSVCHIDKFYGSMDGAFECLSKLIN